MQSERGLFVTIQLYDIVFSLEILNMGNKSQEKDDQASYAKYEDFVFHYRVTEILRNASVARGKLRDHNFAIFSNP